MLKKNVYLDIIKTILGYLPIAVLETLGKWKVVITSVEQESTEDRQDYKTGTDTTYGEQCTPMNIGKARENFDKDGKPRYFNCNIYGYIEKECKKPKKK